MKKYGKLVKYRKEELQKQYDNILTSIDSGG